MLLIWAIRIVTTWGIPLIDQILFARIAFVLEFMVRDALHIGTSYSRVSCFSTLCSVCASPSPSHSDLSDPYRSQPLRHPSSHPTHLSPTPSACHPCLSTTTRCVMLTRYSAKLRCSNNHLLPGGRSQTVPSRWTGSLPLERHSLMEVGRRDHQAGHLITRTMWLRHRGNPSGTLLQ